MRNLIKKIIHEEIKNGKVICDFCGWSWKLSEGGDDPYTCHKCGHDNKPVTSNFEKILNKFENLFPQNQKNKVTEIKKFIENYILKSGYKIKFLNACPTFFGVRTKDQIIICAPNSMTTLGDFVYTIFHEIRHEQQISEIKMPNPLSEFDLNDFERLYQQYWEMELDADQFAKNMVAKLVRNLDIPIEYAKNIFKLSAFIENYPQSSFFVRKNLEQIIEKIKEMKSKGKNYSDIQDHPIIKPYVEKLESFI